MPDLSKYPVPMYEAGQPYHWNYDNIPITNLSKRDEVINDELEIHADILISAAGSLGTLDARLDQSIEENGNLKESAINETLHNIAEHSDGNKTVDNLDYYNNTLGYTVDNPVEFVRMLNAERAKLALIANEAKNIYFQIETPSETVEIDSGIIKLTPSNYIQWSITPGNPNIVKPIAVNPRYYDITPVPANINDPDYINYKVTSIGTAFIENSLRIYINGIRITTDVEIYVPGKLPTDDWKLNKFTPNATNGTFELLNAITEDDVIRIDFEISL